MNPEFCPKCDADFKGAPIPEESLKYYEDGVTHYSRLIGISNWDSVTHWKCPYCEHTWKR